MASNLVARLKLNGSLLFGVTGCKVKAVPGALRVGVITLPTPFAGPLLFAVHSFKVRMPRGMSSFFVYGESASRLVPLRSVSRSSPSSF